MKTGGGISGVQMSWQEGASRQPYGSAMAVPLNKIKHTVANNSNPNIHSYQRQPMSPQQIYPPDSNSYYSPMKTFQCRENYLLSPLSLKSDICLELVESTYLDDKIGRIVKGMVDRRLAEHKVQIANYSRDIAVETVKKECAGNGWSGNCGDVMAKPFATRFVDLALKLDRAEEKLTKLTSDSTSIHTTLDKLAETQHSLTQDIKTLATQLLTTQDAQAVHSTQLSTLLTLASDIRQLEESILSIYNRLDGMEVQVQRVEKIEMEWGRVGMVGVERGEEKKREEGGESGEGGVQGGLKGVNEIGGNGGGTPTRKIKITLDPEVKKSVSRKGKIGELKHRNKSGKATPHKDSLDSGDQPLSKTTPLLGKTIQPELDQIKPSSIKFPSLLTSPLSLTMLQSSLTSNPYFTKTDPLTTKPSRVPPIQIQEESSRENTSRLPSHSSGELVFKEIGMRFVNLTPNNGSEGGNGGGIRFPQEVKLDGQKVPENYAIHQVHGGSDVKIDLNKEVTSVMLQAVDTKRPFKLRRNAQGSSAKSISGKGHFDKSSSYKHAAETPDRGSLINSAIDDNPQEVEQAESHRVVKIVPSFDLGTVPTEGASPGPMAAQDLELAPPTNPSYLSPQPQDTTTIRKRVASITLSQEGSRESSTYKLNILSTNQPNNTASIPIIQLSSNKSVEDEEEMSEETVFIDDHGFLVSESGEFILCDRGMKVQLTPNEIAALMANGQYEEVKEYHKD